MPIDSNGSSLQVSTNIGGTIKDHEDYLVERSVEAHNPSPVEEPVMEKPTEMKRRRTPPKTDDKKLKQALTNDLKKRNLKS
jgi:hypothetical protein